MLCVKRRSERASSDQSEDYNHHPCREKSGLDPEELQSYRQISNLTFVSKVIERVVAEQIRAYLN